MITITPSIQIEENELQFEFIRASGPGGQNVNKVSTACQLRFDVAGSPALEPEVKTRLAVLAGKRMTADGMLVIEAKRFRSQEKNRADAIDRLVILIQKAAQPILKRTRTRPTRSSMEKRLTAKKHHSQLKRNRQSGINGEI